MARLLSRVEATLWTGPRGHSGTARTAAGGGERSSLLSAPQNYFSLPSTPLESVARRYPRKFGESESGGIPGEAASRSPREKGPKSRRGRGRLGALQPRRAEETEPEPEPARVPAVVARPIPAGAPLPPCARSRECP